MVTTPLLPLRPGGNGLSEGTRILWPLKSAETLPPTNGKVKLLPKEAHKEEQGDAFASRVSPFLPLWDKFELLGKRRSSGETSGEENVTSITAEGKGKNEAKEEPENVKISGSRLMSDDSRR